MIPIFKSNILLYSYILSFKHLEGPNPTQKASSILPSNLVFLDTINYHQIQLQ